MPDLASGQARFGPFTFDVRTGELLKGGIRIRVPDQSVEVLKTLLERPGELITREELRQRLWPDNTFVDFEHGLNAAVRRLRDALGDSAEAPRYIETLPRRGYRFLEAVAATMPGPVAAAPTAVPGAPSTLATPVSPPPSNGGARERIAWTAVAALGVAVIALSIGLVLRRPSVEPRGDPVRFTIALPEGVIASRVAVSPDGRRLAFVASSQGVPALWLKPMSEAMPSRLDGTDGADHPFWSPDNRTVGFFADKKLKTIRIDGGRPDVICDAPAGRGGTWNQQNEIVFAPSTDGTLERVTLSDRRPVAITTKTRGDTTHRVPSFLPDGRHFLYSAGGGGGEGRVQIGSLDSVETEELPIPYGESAATFSGGHIVFIRSGNLMAQPFDPSSRRLIGEAFSAADGPTAWFSVSTTGVLAVQGARGSRLTIVDREGGRSRVLDDRTFMVGLSPDGRFVATAISGDVQVVDLSRRTPTRLTFARSQDFFPVWGPDSESLVFSSTRNGRYQLFRTRRNTSGQEEMLYDDPSTQIVVATDWSRDDRFLAVTKSGPETASIWILPLAVGAKAFPFRQVPAAQGNAHFSPDGRWIAFSSDESGKRKEVYVAPFPGPGPVQQVSIAGGTQPQWQADGSELFFFAPDGSMMSAAVVKGPQLKTDPPRKLFQVPVQLTIGHGNEYAVSSDGQKFLINVQDPAPPIEVTVNPLWRKTP